MDDFAVTFQEELNQQTINLPRAALLYARAIAYPFLDVDHYLNQLDTFVEAAREQVDPDGLPVERAKALSDFLFGEMRFQGNQHDYYDPCNSYLNCVLDRKTGIPISLGLVYITIAQRLDIRAYGIGLPGHFVVGVYAEGSQTLFDPFNGGMQLSLADCGRLVRQSTGFEGAFHQKWLRPISPSDVLARLLTNLCNAYIQREEWNLAIPAIQHLLMVQPDTDFHLRDLGYLHLYNGSLRLSAQYLEEYLHRSPDADDFENVRSSLQIIASRLALWN